MEKPMHVSGWGRYPEGYTRWVVPQLGSFPGGVGIARGLGRSYGDAAFSTKGHTWVMTGYTQLLEWKPETGLLVAQAGLSLYALIQRFLPEGWFPKVVPGTQWVTLGGAFASNIHGKNHHLEGSFAEHVLWIKLRTPTGEALRLSPADPIFWATAGGMGLTGIVEEVALQLERVPSSWILNSIRKVASWEEALALLEAEEMQYPFAVAWLDHHHPKNRAILTWGDGQRETKYPRAGPSTLLTKRGGWGFPLSCPFGFLVIGVGA